MNLVALKSELTTDPLARGYAGMNDEAAANSLNTKDRPVLRKVIPTYEIFEAIIPSEFDALTAPIKARVQMLLGLGQISVNGANAKLTLLGAFNGGSNTRAALIALATQLGGRGDELWLGLVTPLDVADARRLA